MGKHLMIVESPAKAKTIEKYLGKDFMVKSCYGHIRDLVKGKKGLGIDVNHGYKPEYEVPADKRKIVKELKELAKKVDEIWLGTDEDREGEAIAWHLCEVLGLNPEEVKRIVFHEITKDAIQKAIKNPRHVDLNLVNAQQARRILDRLVGFELSPLLWRKVSMKQALSAGRVQSVAVRLIVEREKEIRNFKPKVYYRVDAIFQVTDKDGKKQSFKATLNKRFDTRQEAEQFLKRCTGKTFTVLSYEKKPFKKSPPPPFITSTLQQEASRKLGFPVSKTMMIAQRLYESGKITYMRTDSVNLSDYAINAAADVIRKKFGEKYSQPRQYKSKSATAQEAHEAIRPTDFNAEKITGDRDEQRLYELIWKRAVASQMRDAELDRTIIKIGHPELAEVFTATGETVRFDGYLKLYIESTDDEEQETSDSALLPAVEEGQALEVEKITATQRFTQPPARYNEAMLVRKLEELGIGRPSTYAPIISTIQKRGYVIKKSTPGEKREYEVMVLEGDKIKSVKKTETTGAEKSKLFPTDLGIIVTEFLMEHFKKVMDYGFTAEKEKEFDAIASGLADWVKIVDSFYKPFHQEVEETQKTARRVTGERFLGEDPATGKPVYVQIGKYGPMVRIGETDSDEKPKFASLREGQSIETITLEEALNLFKLPRQLGEYEDKPVSVSIGRFGPYVRHGDKFYSLEKNQDPYSITLEEAIALIKKKQEEAENRVIANWEDKDIAILKGRYGPYIKSGKRNIRIPKDKDPYKLTLEEVEEIIANAPEKKKRTRK